MTDDLYATLGVSREATEEDVQRAYRSRSKKAHPDAGGDPEGFRVLRLARDVLCDPVRRRAYDDTGFIPGEEDIEVEAIAAILRIAASVHKQFPSADFPREIRSFLRQSIDECRGRVRLIQTSITEIQTCWFGAEVVRDRLLAGFEGTQAELRERVNVYDRALELLQGAEWKRRRW